MSKPLSECLADFADWAATHITGDEKGEAQIFLDRTLEPPGANPLKDAHAALDALDAAVLAAYGFSAKADLWKPTRQ